ncbi:MAG: SsrA-binding protein SmpB [Alphaproteobacteria bacterium]|nr:SsrA-binding protein SmpB [Alphaproteobacteria bacterium]MBU0796477.1 SsrA-binding protein SmpB [Alphaproteobacteria bacterium]MBU0885648.1 SsrA-binding protein SmpB [Alphaproteobacteria bacterium]MBU1812696.1 SsrA-binding protein SmpB [Alphaproteobacteria bacterium]
MAEKAERYRIVADNRRARHDYFIEDTLEVGIMLHGTEVKALRAGRASIGESYAGPKQNELFLYNAYIPEYGQASNQLNHEPRRQRKLLVHGRELNKLVSQIKREGVTLVPLQVYFNERGFAKLQLGLAKGKKLADKRETAKKRDWQRDQARILRDKG